MDAAAGESWHGGETRRELSRVVADVLGRRSDMLSERLEVASGRPAEEILRLANERPCDLIVMSTHGLTGRRRLFFGATTERVLRSATVPVLVTRPDDPGPESADQIGVLVNRILVPVDLDGSAPHTVHVAAGLAPVFKAPLLVVHVVEPARLPFPRRSEAPRLDRERRAEADQALDSLADEVPPGVLAETLVAYGDAPEEIVKGRARPARRADRDADSRRRREPHRRGRVSRVVAGGGACARAAGLSSRSAERRARLRCRRPGGLLGRRSRPARP